MNAKQIIELLTQKQIIIAQSAGKLSVTAAKGAVTPMLAGLIRDNKAALVAYLESAPGGEITVKNPLLMSSVSRDNNIPLSFAQQQLWMIDNIESDSASANYNVFNAMKVSGEFDEVIAGQAFNHIIARHEPLRTRFVQQGEEVWQVVVKDVDFQLQRIDLQHLNGRQQQAQLATYIDEQGRKPFDLSADLKVRVSFVRLAVDKGVLVVNMHHIASDNWSMGIFTEEFIHVYQSLKDDQPITLTPLKVQYADYAVWQKDHLQGEVLQELLDYWQNRLADIPQVHQLPLDKVRPERSSYHGNVHQQRLGQSMRDQLVALAQSQGATLYMVLQSAYAILLSRFSGESDIVMGSAIANRGQAEIAPLIGFFVNTMVQRVDVSGDPRFVDLLARGKRHLLADFKHQQLPFELLVEHLNPQRQLNRNPLFQLGLNLTVSEDAGEELSNDLAKTRFEYINRGENVSNFDLTLSVVQSATGLVMGWRYATDVFSEQGIAELASAFEVLLGSIVAAPTANISQLALITPAQRADLLETKPQPKPQPTPYSTDVCLHHLFEQQVALHPQKTALVINDQQLSYEQLNARANQLAHCLMSKGVKPDSLVGICAERSFDMVVGLLAILKAGGAYVPIDPSYPAERKRYILADSAVSLVVSQTSLASSLPLTAQQLVLLDSPELANQPMTALNTDVQSNHLAYMIYTSGSTGQPKGVLVEHQSVVEKLQSVAQHYQITADDAMLLFASISFDASVSQLFAPLSVGATVVIRPDDITEPVDFMAYVVAHQVSLMHLVPQYLSQLLADDSQLATHWDQSKLRTVISGGDVLTASLANLWREKGRDIALFNSYGPTETTITASSFEYDGCVVEGVSLPIGAPLGNSQFYVVDEQLQLLPVGAVGELLVGGAAVVRGYHNHPQLTEQRFITNPFVNGETQAERLYRTGDRVRRLADGNLLFVGRQDAQVKIRGFRVEPGEVEAQLNACQWVKSAAVVVVTNQQGDKKLNAYVVAADLAQTDLAQTDLALLNDYLAQRLPFYMVPSELIALDALPLTVSGKIDRAALVLLKNEQTGNESIAPRDEIEQQLQVIWLGLLDVDTVGVTESFFQLGGHSLLAMRLASQIKKCFTVNFTLKTLFESPSIEAQAQVISFLRQCEAQAQTQEDDEQIEDELML